MSPVEIISAISQQPSGVAAEKLAARLRAALGEELLRGVARKEATSVVWLLEIESDLPPIVVELSEWTGKHQANGEPLNEPGHGWRWPMQRLGDSNIYTAAAELPNYIAFEFEYQIKDQHLGKDWMEIEYYPLHSDSLPQAGVPKGAITKYHHKSAILDGAERDYWVYIPAQYQPDGPPACLMIFQDGGLYLNSPASAPTVFDNLIHKHEMPLTVGLFIDSGYKLEEGKEPQSVRIAEYHDMSDRYGRFLRDEIIPEVEKLVHLRKDAAGHAICGISSGAVCSFTAAWQRPELFSKVVCHVGSFVNIMGGGYQYPFIIRDNPKKPLRIYLQDGANDLDDACGSWPLANQQMARALQFKGYDYKFDFGQGFHNLAYGGSTLPETLKWLWQDH